MTQSDLQRTEKDLLDYVLFLADSSLIMGHRLSQWTGHGPMLEQDIALTNIALDLIGQARNFYQYAASLANASGENLTPVTEDTLAYLRDSRDFKNLLITELPNGDWAYTITKLFFFSVWQLNYYRQLKGSDDTQLSAVAEKSAKEVAYHVTWSSDWVLRLGDGTSESHRRMVNAVEALWPYTGEFFEPEAFRDSLEKIAPADVGAIESGWRQKVWSVLEEATLPVPNETWMQKGGREGMHTEHLGYLLAEMQFMQRAYPGLEW